jgi:hypothetical protein
MANFTIRVELINHKDPEDYNILHQEMYNKAFYRVVKLDNVWHDMPTAEYTKNSLNTINQIYDEVRLCADKAIKLVPAALRITTSLSLKPTVFGLRNLKKLLILKNFRRVKNCDQRGIGHWNDADLRT